MMSQAVESMWTGTAVMGGSGADPGGGARVCCSTSTPINHIVVFLQNTSCIRKLQVIAGGGGGVHTPNTPPHTPYTLPLDPPLNGLREAKRQEPKTFWGSQIQNIVNSEKEMK